MPKGMVSFAFLRFRDVDIYRYCGSDVTWFQTRSPKRLR